MDVQQETKTGFADRILDQVTDGSPRKLLLRQEPAVKAARLLGADGAFPPYRTAGNGD